MALRAVKRPSFSGLCPLCKKKKKKAYEYFDSLYLLLNGSSLSTSV